jgi:hypothetical protein
MHQRAPFVFGGGFVFARTFKRRPAFYNPRPDEYNSANLHQCGIQENEHACL